MRIYLLLISIALLSMTNCKSNKNNNQDTPSMQSTTVDSLKSHNELNQTQIDSIKRAKTLEKLKKKN